MKARSIALVTSGLALGGSEVQIVYLADGLKRADWNVTVVSFQRGPLERELKDLAIPLFISPMGRFATPRSWGNIVGLLRELAPDLIQTQAFRANLWGRLASFRLQVPVVASIRASYSYLPRAYRPVERFLSTRSAALITPAQASASYLVAKVGVPPDLINVIPNGVDVEFFGAKPGVADLRRQWAPDGAFLVLAPGRLVPQKNHAQVIRAFAKMGMQNPNSVLVIAGSGPLEAELRQQAKDGRARVLFVGELGRSEIAAAMGVADVVCLASKFEGMPNVVLEAMASGKPVVATRVDGTQEIVEHGREGFLVQPDDDSQLAAALETLSHEPLLRHEMGEAGRRRVLREHSLHANIERHIRLYEHVLAKASRASEKLGVPEKR